MECVHNYAIQKVAYNETYRIAVNYYKYADKKNPNSKWIAYAKGYNTYEEAESELSQFLYCVENCFRRGVDWTNEWFHYDNPIVRENVMVVEGSEKFWELDDDFIRARNAINHAGDPKIPSELRTNEKVDAMEVFKEGMSGPQSEDTKRSKREKGQSILPLELCTTYVLSQQPDFLGEISALEEVILRYGYRMMKSSKCHPELAD